MLTNGEFLNVFCPNCGAGLTATAIPVAVKLECPNKPCSWWGWLNMRIGREEALKGIKELAGESFHNR